MNGYLSQAIVFVSGQRVEDDPEEHEARLADDELRGAEEARESLGLLAEGVAAERAVMVGRRPPAVLAHAAASFRPAAVRSVLLSCWPASSSVRGRRDRAGDRARRGEVQVERLQQVPERGRVAGGDLASSAEHRDRVALVVGLAGELRQAQQPDRGARGARRGSGCPRDPCAARSALRCRRRSRRSRPARGRRSGRSSVGQRAACSNQRSSKVASNSTSSASSRNAWSSR